MTYKKCLERVQDNPYPPKSVQRVNKLSTYLLSLLKQKNQVSCQDKTHS